MSGQGAQRSATDSPARHLPYYRCLGDFDVDEWPWAKRPVAPYLICTDPRSGSTWLCEELRWRGLAEPLEYLNPAYVAYLAGRWQCATPPQYRMALWKFRTNAGGVLGMKVLGLHFFNFLSDGLEAVLNPAQPVTSDENLSRIVDYLMPDTSLIWLRRRDKHAQAVSWWMAVKTQEWLRFSPAHADRAEKVEYDFSEIKEFYASLKQFDLRWQQFFASRGQRPIELFYEDILTRPEQSMGQLSLVLGGAFERTSDLDEPRNHVQRTQRTDDWTERFRHEVSRD